MTQPTNAKPVLVGLFGFGNVGQGTAQILSENAALLATKLGRPVKIKTAVVRTPEKYKDHPLAKNITLSDDPNAVLSDPEIDIIVEAMGGEHPAADYIKQALQAGKFVVTANKEVVAKHKAEFFRIAKENKADIHFEAAVAGSIPIIQSLKVGLSANHIQSLTGILNGTTNYILTKILEENRNFDDVLKEAQDLGFAEADPTMDVSGADAAYKLAILAAAAFGVEIQTDDLYFEGITNISLTDSQYAKRFGYIIKLVGIGQRLKNGFNFKVHPTMIDCHHPIANVRNEYNAVFVTSDMAGDTMLYGKGAGPLPTGSAIVSDIVDIIQNHNQTKAHSFEFGVTLAPTIPIEDTYSRFYIRLSVSNRCGVLHEITGTLAQHDVGIATVIQDQNGQDDAEIVLITQDVLEANMNNALKQLESLEPVKSIASTIRVGLPT